MAPNVNVPEDMFTVKLLVIIQVTAVDAHVPVPVMTNDMVPDVVDAPECVMPPPMFMLKAPVKTVAPVALIVSSALSVKSAENVNVCAAPEKVTLFHDTALQFNVQLDVHESVELVVVTPVAAVYNSVLPPPNVMVPENTTVPVEFIVMLT